MTPRRPTPHSSTAFCALLVGVLAVMGLVGCADPLATAPDGARKDVAVEAGDLGSDTLDEVPGDGGVDARMDRGADEKPDLLAPFTPEDVPATYDIQLDRSWDALPTDALIPLDVRTLSADRPQPDRPGVPCTVGVVEDCACTDGRAGWQVCEHAQVFSPCTCATPPAPPFPLPPRLVFPLSGTRVTSQRPTLRWVLPEGVTRARVELCADRSCTRVLARQELVGTSWRPTSRLSPGVVFWRVQGLDPTGMVTWTSTTWLFQVRARDAAADTAYGRIRDFNGDGYDDLVIQQWTTNDLAELRVFFGSPRGIGPQAELVLRTLSTGPRRALAPEHIVADLTGDGLADLLVYDGPIRPAEQRDPRAIWDAYLYEGHRTFPLARRVARMRVSPHFQWGVMFSVVDHDADGFNDLYAFGFRSLGSPAGPGELSLVGSGRDAEWQADDIADVDGDGYVEYLEDHEHYRRAYGRFPLLPRETWQVPPLLGYTHNPGQYCPIIAGDINGDRYTDLVGYCGVSDADLETSSYMKIFPIYGREGEPRRGVLQLTPIRRQEPMVRGGTSSGDLNGDGLVDHLLQIRDRGLSWIYGTSERVLAIPVTVGNNAIQLASACGDLNGDGFDDILLVTLHDGNWSMHILEGSLVWSGRYTSRRLDTDVFRFSF